MFKDEVEELLHDDEVEPEELHEEPYRFVVDLDALGDEDETA